jgi:hypothetical protein
LAMAHRKKQLHAHTYPSWLFLESSQNWYNYI